MNSLRATVTATIGGYLMMHYGSDVAKAIKSEIINKIVTSVKVNRTSVYSYSVLQHINKTLSSVSSHTVIDHNSYRVANGCYTVDHVKADDGSVYTVNVEIADSYIELYMYVSLLDTLDRNSLVEAHKSNKTMLTTFINEIHALSTDPTQYTVKFIMQDNGKWSSPIVNKHRKIINLTPEMLDVKNSIKHFLKLSTKTDYENRGIPYRYGMLLCGESGTGKSTVCEYITQKYMYDMCCINLISESMTDALLQQSCVTVNGRPLIVIDEFDKMYKQFVANNKTKLTMAGVLSAIDGVIRLPETCIVIVIMNGKLNDVIVDHVHRTALVRHGRLDKCVEFNTPYVL